MFYIRLMYLRQTTEGYYNTSFDVSKQRHGRMKSFRKGHVTCRMLSIKRDCFLVCFVQNIRYLVGMSDVTTISNNQGNILQISCKTSLKKNEYHCVVQMHGLEHATFPVIPKRCCNFSVVQSFQFEFATHLMYIQGKRSQLIDRKYNYREC